MKVRGLAGFKVTYKCQGVGCVENEIIYEMWAKRSRLIGIVALEFQ